MRVSGVTTFRIIGIQAEPITVETDVVRGLSAFSIVGLADKAVCEAKDRVCAAIRNSGFISPKQRNQKVVVSLAPADAKKAGSHYDLAIAISYLKASGQFEVSSEDSLAVAGEVGLDGSVRYVRGAIAMAQAASKHELSSMYLPRSCHDEVIASGCADDVAIHALDTLSDFFDHDCVRCGCGDVDERFEAASDAAIPFSDIRGHEALKRAGCIAVAGRHHLMLCGPPGSGKTLLASSLVDVCPPLSDPELTEVAAIRSVTGRFSSSLITNSMSRRPPFRSPHHAASYSALLGSASGQVGEITLAHKGILFLDEFPEFDRRAIEGLREPLEEKNISLSSASAKVTLPADFMLVATMNPSSNVRGLASTKTTRKELSDAIIDRFDMWIEVAPVDKDVLSRVASEISVIDYRSFVMRARNILDALSDAGVISSDDILKLATARIRSLVMSVSEKLKLSSRGMHRVVRLAQTIAALDSRDHLVESDVLEAASYRRRVE